MVRKAASDAEIDKCYETIVELRTHIPREGFLERIRKMEREGYRLASIEDGDEVVAVAGYRICTNLFMGKHLYVDDLVTSSKHRSRGYGAQLIEWLKKEAVKAQCSFFNLDSGIQRGDAHRFYFNQGLKVASFHFSEQL